MSARPASSATSTARVKTASARASCMRAARGSRSAPGPSSSPGQVAAEAATPAKDSELLAVVLSPDPGRRQAPRSPRESDGEMTQEVLGLTRAARLRPSPAGAGWRPDDVRRRYVDHRLDSERRDGLSAIDNDDDVAEEVVLDGSATSWLWSAVGIAVAMFVTAIGVFSVQRIA